MSAFQGIPYPITMCTSETFQALETFEARHDDIVVASYPKCGSNWILHIVSELIFTVSKKKYEYPEFPVLECGDSEKYQRMEDFPSPRILATHLHYDKLPGSIFKNKAKRQHLTMLPRPVLKSWPQEILWPPRPPKVILVISSKTLKSTAVSFFISITMFPDIPSYDSWDEFFRQFMKDKNLAAGIKQIAEFLGFFLTGEQIQTISVQSTFQAMRAKSQNTHGAVGPFLFRKGEVGDWKNLLSQTQNQEMDENFKECLAGTSLGAKLKYESYCQG
nr:sulfotransferase 6B1 [Aotus nancymaae]